jgi:hypothetical protein
MPKGSPIIKCRISPEEYKWINHYVYLKSIKGGQGSITVSQFLRAAIREKIDHLKRSKKSKKSVLVEEPVSWCTHGNHNEPQCQLCDTEYDEKQLKQAQLPLA